MASIRKPVSAQSNVLKVSVVEAGGVFQAKPQHSIETYVRGPNQGKRQQSPFRGQNSDADQNCWREKCVNRVVNRGTNSGIYEIAEHKKIRREEEDSE